MLTVSGKQFIFTRVEAEYSPVGQGKFQVFYSSDGIANADLQMLTTIASCFSAKGFSFVRRQFFQLPSGCFAFVNTVSANHPVITDKKRNDGNYIVHALVIDYEMFSTILFNPFKVFDNFSFVNSAERMVKEFNHLERREPSSFFEVDPYSPIVGGESYSNKAVSLFKMARLSEQKDNTLNLVGKTQDVEAFLRCLIQFSPFNTRRTCTFDTYSDNCQVPNGLFWIIGASLKRSDTKNVLDLSLGIPAAVDNQQVKDNLYFSWLQDAIRINPTDAYDISSFVQLLSHSFEKNLQLDVAALDMKAVQSFYQKHKKIVLRRFEDVISNAITPSIARRILANLPKLGVGFFEILLVASPQAKIGGVMLPILRNLIAFDAPQFSNWKKEDWKKIQKFAISNVDHVILFWAATLGKNQSSRLATCAMMSEGDYFAALSLLLTPIEPKYFMPSSDKNLRVLIAKVVSKLNEIDDRVFTEFVLELYQHELYEHLEAIESRIRILDNKSLSYLEGRLRKLPVNSIFIKSLRSRRKEIGRPAGIKGFFYKEN
jgi:hypothetical protein